MKVVAIVNPISGAGAGARAASGRIALLSAELARRSLRPTIHVTTHAGHAHALARAAVEQGAGIVLVWGGDGTANEVGAALVGTGVALGLIPAGSGNGLAAALESPRDPAAAISRALDSGQHAIDAGLLAERPFFNIAGVGADARIARLFNARAKGSRGRWPYVLLGVREAFRYRARAYRVELDGEARQVRALLIAFANGGEYGNGVRLTADARPDDGLLDAVVIEDRPVAARFRDAAHLLRGRVQAAPGVQARRVSHAVIDSGEPIEYHVDGEPGIAEGPVHVTIRPGALLVRG